MPPEAQNEENERPEEDLRSVIESAYDDATTMSKRGDRLKTPRSPYGLPRKRPRPGQIPADPSETNTDGSRQKPRPS